MYQFGIFYLLTNNTKIQPKLAKMIKGIYRLTKINLGGMLQALVDASDCSKPPCNSPGSALSYTSHPAFPDSLLGKVCDSNPVKQYLHSKSLYIVFFLSSWYLG